MRVLFVLLLSLVSVFAKPYLRQQTLLQSLLQDYYAYAESEEDSDLSYYYSVGDSDDYDS
jgi:hypothetical protein